MSRLGNRWSLRTRAGWLREYQRPWLRSDMIAGVTLAAYAIPVSMAYASLAGLPPQFGIYCYVLGGIAYALFGTCRQLAIGPTSAIALLVGTTVAPMADGDASRWVAISSLTAMVVSGLCVIAWSLRLSGLVSFISETVLVGFKAGAALTIAMTQLPKLFGVSGGGDHFVERVRILAGQLPDANPWVLAVGAGAILSLLLSDRVFPGRSAALLVVIVATAAGSVISLPEWGITTLGVLPSGLPVLRVPAVGVRDIDGIFALSCACFLLAYIEGISSARALAASNGYEINPRQELLALGAANLSVAFGQGLPVAGGLSQSMVNAKAGAKSPLALVVAAVALAVCLLFLTDLLANLPTVVLAAIVLVAIRGLFDVSAMRRLRAVSRREFRIMLVALGGVLLLGILRGVLFAAIISLIMLLAAAARPHVAFLGRIPGTRRFSDLARHPDNETLTHVLIFRVESSLLYFNVDHVSQVVRRQLDQVPQVELVVCDLSDSPVIDVAGADLLLKLEADLAKRGIKMRVVEAHAAVRDLLRSVGLEQRVGYLGRHLSVETAIDEFSRSRAAAADVAASTTSDAQ